MHDDILCVIMSMATEKETKPRKHRTTRGAGGSPLPAGLIICAISGWLCFSSRILVIFPSNAFMASARSLHTFDRSKRWIEIIVQGCQLSIATKVLVMDLYAVQYAIPARNQKHKTNYKTKKKICRTVQVLLECLRTLRFDLCICWNLRFHHPIW